MAGLPSVAKGIGDRKEKPPNLGGFFALFRHPGLAMSVTYSRSFRPRVFLQANYWFSSFIYRDEGPESLRCRDDSTLI
jgi:hypothetical protein